MWRVGYHYRFNEEEIAELHQESEGFQVQIVEYEMLLKGMEKPAVTEESYMTISEILNYLRGYTTLNLSERRMGEALKKGWFLTEIQKDRWQSNVCLPYTQDCFQSFYPKLQYKLLILLYYKEG